MEIETQYAVKLFFPNTAFIQVYFEAIANALDAMASLIEIKISTDGKINPQYLEITITDNGQGFTDERFERFSRLKEPSDPYHKGLGRLVYLKYFSNVQFVSVFESKKRAFNFSFSNTPDKDNILTKVSESEKRGTTLRFKDFLGNRLRSYDDIKPTALKSKLIERFLPILYTKKRAGEEFKISIRLETSVHNIQKEIFPNTQTITNADIPDLKITKFKNKSHLFEEISMFYMVEEGEGKNYQLTAICIDGQTIPINLLNSNAIPLNHSAIFLFESSLFNGKSDNSRQRLVLPDEISEASLHRELRSEMSTVLNTAFPEIKRKNNETKQQFEKRYPHLIGLFEENTVGIIDREEAIEIAQKRFFQEQKQILESNNLDDETFEKSLEISSRALTEYILYRELIIKQLKGMNSRHRESDIHSLIVPRYQRFHQKDLVDGVYTNNAWLLDDKFMSFRTILSEAKMQELIATITLKEDATLDHGRPDISMIFSADPKEVEKVDVVVVEIKRRKVDDKENPYAAVQLLKRARKLIEYCPEIQRIWYFAIIEIDQTLSQLLEDMGWKPLFSRGQVFYQPFEVKSDSGVSIPTPIYLLSYEAVIQDAEARNHTFLEILKRNFKNTKSSLIKA